MSEGLRAEDVKEAAAIYEEWLAETGNAPGPAMAPLLAAARLWGASQEQTPDYEAAAKQLLWWTTEIEWEDLEDIDPIILGQARSIVDAALVGFHPQPAENQR